MVLGAEFCVNGENEMKCHLSYRSRTQRAITSHNETIGPSEDRRSAIDLAIIREDLSRPHLFLRWVDGKAPEIMAARRQERRERERVPRVKSPLKLREPVYGTSIPVTPTPTVT